MCDIVYKVIFRDLGGKPISIVAEGDAEVTYKVGEFVSAPEWLAVMGYHLIVFKTKQHAEKWSLSRSNEIWQVEAEDEINLPPMLSVGMLGWNNMIQKSDGDWPKGTRMYKRVKLLKRVK